ncbi:uncharacterized protein BX664DRAFT_317674 [Halteromyces radiatus]|uniref:uncharacterized protein n=1 Tax=Halteromyces radiatus TaxID=101107 RepID=UPI00221FA773|nr:uncharacterized protein BX664DRAFT_317674 [Halteromyces radiatus]KAI8079767.1 hypothetical protein BX664DRAFT_317674 [Halteromyces radiatus]
MMRRLPTWMYPYPDILPQQRSRTLHAAHSYTRKFCGCMSLRGGCTVACFIWIGLNLYGSILAFQGQSHRTALLIQGAICLIFVLVALFALFAVFVNMPGTLSFAHRSIWMVVIVFLIDFFVCLVLFGVQQPQFQDWCINKSRSVVRSELSSGNGTTIQLTFSPHIPGSDLYNCTRLWQDEVKFAVVTFVMIAVCYVYWATCLWSYEQKVLVLFSSELQQGAIEDSARMANFNSMTGMMNMPPSNKAQPPSVHSDNGQQTLAQITTNALSSLFSKFRS